MELYWILLSFSRRRAPLNILIKLTNFCQIAELCEFEVK